MFKFEQDTAAKFLQDVMKPNDRASDLYCWGHASLVQPRDTAESSISGDPDDHADKGIHGVLRFGWRPRPNI